MSLAEQFEKLEKDAFDAAHDQQETGKNMREVLSDYVVDLLDDLARSECVHCCRATEIRKARAEIDHFRSHK